MTAVKAAKTRLEAALIRLEGAVEHRVARDSGTALNVELEAMRHKLADLESRYQAMRQRYAKAVEMNGEITTRLNRAIETVQTVLAE